MQSNLKPPESAWLTDWLTDKTVSYLDLYWPIWTNRITQNQPKSTCINPYQPVSTRINLYQPVSTCINPYQPESTQINLYQPISIGINLNQPELTQNQPESTRINRYQLRSIRRFLLVCTPDGTMDPSFQMKYIPSKFVLVEKLVLKQIPLFFEAPCSKIINNNRKNNKNRNNNNNTKNNKHNNHKPPLIIFSFPKGPDQAFCRVGIVVLLGTF